MNILITGSVMNSDSDSIKIYEKLEILLSKQGYTVSSPLDTMKFTGSDKERYERAMVLLNKADLIIAEVSIPSTGQGMELQQGIINKIPIMAIAKKTLIFLD